MSIPDWEIELISYVEVIHFGPTSTHPGESEKYVPYLAAQQMLAAAYARIAELQQWQNQMIDAMLDMRYDAMVRLTMAEVRRRQPAQPQQPRHDEQPAPESGGDRPSMYRLWRQENP